MLKGKIYALYSNTILKNNEYVFYIGSTTNNSIKHRIRNHWKDFKKYHQGKRNWCSSFTLFEQTSNPNFVILEEDQYENIDNLRRQENKLIELFQQNILNKKRAFKENGA